MTSLYSIYTSKRLTGLEGECEPHRQMKTVRRTVFRERDTLHCSDEHAAASEMNFSQDGTPFTPTKYGGLAQQVRALA